jgi:organic hydroperoxide reductase OsmC/OhrA
MSKVTEFESAHGAIVRWTRDGQPFTDARYSRRHRWLFDGGVSIPASASPEHVGVPLSDPSSVDPEEAFVAALASCHMLVFLHRAALAGLVVDEYEDSPVGFVRPDEEGHLALTRVVLRPRVVVTSAPESSDDAVARLHEQAHHGCFLARSLRAELVVEPVVLRAGS